MKDKKKPPPKEYKIELKGGVKVFNAPNDHYAGLLAKTLKKLDK